MAVTLRGKRPDVVLKQIIAALNHYAEQHPRADVEVYRHNNVSVRIRVIDPTFTGMSRADREDDLWAALQKLPEEMVAEISLLLLLTPQEAKKSFANVEFDNPVPSGL